MPKTNFLTLQCGSASSLPCFYLSPLYSLYLYRCLCRLGLRFWLFGRPSEWRLASETYAKLLTQKATNEMQTETETETEPLPRSMERDNVFSGDRVQFRSIDFFAFPLNWPPVRVLSHLFWDASVAYNLRPEIRVNCIRNARYFTSPGPESSINAKHAKTGGSLQYLFAYPL